MPDAPLVLATPRVTVTFDGRPGSGEAGGPLLRPGKPALAWALLKSAAAATGLFLAYGLIPLDRGTRGNGLVLLLIGLAVFVAVVALQLRTVVFSDDPMPRAVRALIFMIPLFLLVFASCYVVMSHSAPHSFSQKLNHAEGFYFSVTVFATVGFGDIVPVSDTARLTVSVQMLADLVVIGGLVRLLLQAVRVNRERSTSAPGTGDDPVTGRDAPAAE